METNVDFPWGFHLWKKIYVFSTATSHISSKLCVLNCALLCDSSRLIMSANDKKSEAFSKFWKKSNVNFLLEVILFLWTKGFQHILASVLMKMCACLEEHLRADCSALFAWFARAALLAGIVKTATGKACNACKTLGEFGLVCVLNARTQM